MPPIVITLLQGLFLLLLYVFVARAVRAVMRDLRTAPSTSRAHVRPPPKQAPRDRPRRAPGELVIHLPDSRPKVISLNGGGKVTFGRTGPATVILQDPYVSDRHAHVFHDGRDWMVEDLGSTNGTFLNRVKVTSPTPIAAGDQLGIGKTIVEVRK